MRFGVRIVGAVVLVALFAGIAGWALHAPRDGAAPSEPVERAAAPPRVPKAVPIPVEPPLPIATAQEGPLAETLARLEAQQNAGPDADFLARREALERAAAAGDAAAAAKLGEQILLCESYVDFGEHDVEALLVEASRRSARRP